MSNSLVIGGRAFPRLNDGAIALADLVGSTPISTTDEMHFMAMLEAHHRQKAIAYATIGGKQVQMPTPISEVIRMAKEMGMTREALKRRIDIWLSKKRYAEFQPIEVLTCDDEREKAYDYDWYVSLSPEDRLRVEHTVVAGVPLFRFIDGTKTLEKYGFEAVPPAPAAIQNSEFKIQNEGPPAGILSQILDNLKSKTQIGEEENG